MTNHTHSISEPLLPEYQLLADAAPEIKLSAGFRSKVLLECAASQALARKILIAKSIAIVMLLIGTVAGAHVLWNRPSANVSIEESVDSVGESNFRSHSLSTGFTSTPQQQQPIAVEESEQVPQP